MANGSKRLEPMGGMRECRQFACQRASVKSVDKLLLRKIGADELRFQIGKLTFGPIVNRQMFCFNC